MSVFLGTLVFAVATYCLLLIVVYFLQARLIYFPTARLQLTPDQIGLTYEDVYFETRDKVRLHGWYIPASGASSTVLFFHGNAGNISHRLESLSIFNRLKVNTFIFDYRGYGNSQGSPDEQGTYQDALAAWEYLLEKRNEPPERIVLFGRSLGGAIAAWLAARVKAKGIILESVFKSLPDLGADHYGFLPVRRLSRFSYDTLSHLPQLSIPVIIVHSRDDEIVHFDHGRKLFAAANQPKQFLELRGDHNEGFVLSGDDYINGLKKYLASLN